MLTAARCALCGLALSLLCMAAAAQAAESAASRSDSTGTKDSEALVQAVSQCKAAMREAGWSERNAESKDKALKDLVRLVFDQLRDFEKVRAFLEPFVQWQEVPDKPRSARADDKGYPAGLSSYEVMEEDEALQQKPIIYFAHADQASGLSYTVMLNVFAASTNNRRGYRWLQTQPYAAVVHKGQVKYSNDITSLSLAGPSLLVDIQLLGIPNIAPEWPCVLVMVDPSGSGGVLLPQLCSFDAESSKWQSGYCDDLDRICEWSYDNSTMILTLKRWYEQERVFGSTSRDMGQLVLEAEAAAFRELIASGKRQSQLDGQMAKLAEAKRAWNADWCEAVDANTWDARYEEFSRRVLAQDALLHETVQTACREHASVEEIRKRLAGHIEFVDLPAEYTQSDAVREALRHAKVPLTKYTDAGRVPSVVYVQKVRAPRGGVFHLLHVTHQRDASLTTVSFGLIAARGGLLTYHLLPSGEPIPDVGALHMHQVWGMALFLTNDVWPDVFFIDGPAGSGSFCSVHGTTYDGANRTWTTPKPPRQFNGSQWQIDKDAGLLKYARSTKGDPPGSANAQFGRDYIDLRVVLGMAGSQE